MRHRMFTAMILAAATAAPAWAQGGGPVDRVAISRTAHDLFLRACVERFADQAAAEQVLEESGLRLAPLEAGARLPVGEPGRVWRGNNPAVPLAVVRRDTAIRCQVIAPFADVDTSVALFRRTATELARPGREVVTERDEAAELGGQPGRQVFLRMGPEDGGLLLALSVATARPGGLGLMITASRTAPEPGKAR